MSRHFNGITSLLPFMGRNTDKFLAFVSLSHSG